MLYRYDPVKLRFEPVSRSRTYVWLLMLTICVVALMSVSAEDVSYEKALQVSVHKTPLTEKNLELKIKDMNFRFPHVAMAQALLESDHMRSDICKENHNLFGMKQARGRITTALGTRRNHAYYSDWENSVIDYALWYATYAHKCKTEQEFLNLLSASYAEAGHYQETLLRIINDNNLREKFSDS